MTGTTANRSYPFPDLTDSPNGPQEIQDLADAIDVDVQDLIDGLVGTLLGGASTQYIRFSAAQTVNLTSLGTGYADVSTAVAPAGKLGTAFVVPPSGRVNVRFGCNGFSGTTGSSLLVAVAVNTGAVVGGGSPQVAASDDDAMVFSLLGDSPGSRVLPVIGLVPGNTYNAWMRCHNSGTTTGSHIDRPWLEVEPIIA